MLRLVLEGKATLSEIERYWTLSEVELVNEALDAWHEAEAMAAQK